MVTATAFERQPADDLSDTSSGCAILLVIVMLAYAVTLHINVKLWSQVIVKVF